MFIKNGRFNKFQMLENSCLVSLVYSMSVIINQKLLTALICPNQLFDEKNLDFPNFSDREIREILVTVSLLRADLPRGKADASVVVR